MHTHAPTQLVREWQGMTSAAEVAVSGLSVGPHHFACSVPGHCPAGMRFTVTVVPEGEEEGESSDEVSVCVCVCVQVHPYIRSLYTSIDICTCYP